MCPLCSFQLRAFQPFFISLNLPYAVIRGEELALEVTIFNYLKEATEVIYGWFCDSFTLQEKTEKTHRDWVVQCLGPRACKHFIHSWEFETKCALLVSSLLTVAKGIISMSNEAPPSFPRQPPHFSPAISLLSLRASLSCLPVFFTRLPHV